MKNKIILFLIVLLAFCLRIFAIMENPPALNWDEVSLGYNAYSILNTGRDEWGKVLPIIFTAYGDYKLPGYIYFLIPFIKVFGLNEFSVRIPSVIAGSLTVLFTYLIVRELSKKYDDAFNTGNLALLSSLLVAVEPWSLFLSRPAFEANLALCFFLAGFYFFLLSQHTIYFLLCTIFFFGLSVWTYNSFRIFTPLFLILLIFTYKKELLGFLKNKLLITYSLLLTTLLFLPMLYQLFAGMGQERYKKVAIIDDGAVGQIVNMRNKYNFNPIVEKMIFNRPAFFAYNFSKNILAHFSPKFLFFEGGSNYQFSVPGLGVLYVINSIFLLIGILYLLKKHDRTAAILIGWLILGAIPSSLTREAPHVLRSITMLPVPMIITSIGIIYIIKGFQDRKLENCLRLGKPYGLERNLKPARPAGGLEIVLRYLFLFIYGAILIISTVKYLRVYYNYYRSAYSWSWQYGYKNISEYISENGGGYDKIIVTKKYGEPHEFLLFYTKYDPSLFQNNQNIIRFRQSEWFWVDRYDRYYFVNDWDVPREEWQPFVLESGKEDVDCRRLKCLLVTSPGNAPKTWSKLKEIGFLDGKTAFEIYENN